MGGNQVMRDPETGEQKWDITVPEGYIGEAVQDCLGDLLKAAVSGSEEDIGADAKKSLYKSDFRDIILLAIANECVRIIPRPVWDDPKKTAKVSKS